MGNEAAKPESKIDFFEVTKNLYEFINAVNKKYNLYRRPVVKNAIQRCVRFVFFNLKVASKGISIYNMCVSKSDIQAKRYSCPLHKLLQNPGKLFTKFFR